MCKLRKNICIEFALIFCWFMFLTKADSYFAPYLLVGMLGMCFCIARTIKGYHDAKDKKERNITNIYAFVLSMAVVLANYKLYVGLSDGLPLAVRKIIDVLLIFAGGYVSFKEILLGIENLKPNKSDAKKLNNKKLLFTILWLLLIVEYLIVLFASQYPGELTPDSISQMSQLLSHSYSNHHPYYHTQIIHALISIGLLLFNDINKAVALYSVFSIIVMSSCFIYVIETIYENGKNLKVTIAVFMFYLLMPFHIMYSITMWKDVFFGAAVTCFAVSCYRYLKHIGNLKLDIAILVISSVGVGLLRSNGWLALFVSAIVFAILFKKEQKKIIILLVVVLLSTFVLKHPVLKALNVSQPDTIESLSIPAQQIARVVTDGKELTVEQKQILGQIIDLNKIAENYSSYISDPIKSLARQKNNQAYIKEHVLDLIKVYIQLGLKYPHKYIEAWIDETRGYWNSGYSYWRWSCSVQENSLGICRTVNSESINNFVYKYLGLWESSSILQVFLSIGLYVWAIAVASYRALIKKNKELLFISIPFLAVILSLLVATPVFSEFRYAYAIFCGLPFVLATSLSKDKN